jgi:isopentenyl-diphosphate Delta-isomerase
MKEEPVDILDEKGKKTGRTVLKSEAHKLGLWHGGAHIWLYNSKGEVVMQLRSPKKIVNPNVWDVSVAGHIAAGQTPLETVVQEAQEELGLKVNPADLTFLGTGNFDEITQPGAWRHRVYLWIYALKADNLNLADLVLEEDETSDVRWLSLEQLARDRKDPLKAGGYSPNGVSCGIAFREIPKLLDKH